MILACVNFQTLLSLIELFRDGHFILIGGGEFYYFRIILSD